MPARPRVHDASQRGDGDRAGRVGAKRSWRLPPVWLTPSSAANPAPRLVSPQILQIPPSRAQPSFNGDHASPRGNTSARENARLLLAGFIGIQRRGVVVWLACNRSP